MSITIVAISDTHGMHHAVTVPTGDILIHAGDITLHGDIGELDEINTWLGSLPHTHKILVAGNHDFCFERDPEACRTHLGNCLYLQDQAVTILGIRFYGSPWQPWFFDWAFNLQRGPELRAKWDMIPADTDVLITHGPPYGHGDRTSRGQQVGCEDLLEAVERIRPRLHVFGHIHEDAGISHNAHTTLINASICTRDFRPVNPAQVYCYD
jgi:predicted phosphohydrolase